MSTSSSSTAADFGSSTQVYVDNIHEMAQLLHQCSLSSASDSIQEEQQKLEHQRAFLEWIQDRQDKLVRGWGMLQYNLDSYKRSNSEEREKAKQMGMTPEKIRSIRQALEQDVGSVWNCLCELQTLIDAMRGRIEATRWELDEQRKHLNDEVCEGDAYDVIDKGS